jgi:hypothetical protein
MKLFDRIYEWSIHPGRGVEGFIVFVWYHIFFGVLGAIAAALPIALIVYVVSLFL